LESFSKDKCLGVRINTIKTKKAAVLEFFKKRNIEFSQISWNDEAILLHKITSREISELELVNELHE